MKILLGSGNAAKKWALMKALDKLEIRGYEVIPRDIEEPYTHDLIGYEVIRGAENRNIALKKWAENNNEDYDYLCSIENGYSTDENGLSFIVTYCIFEDKKGNKSIGKSFGVRLTRTMFEFIKEGGSLIEIIEETENLKDIKNDKGITGYLSNNLYDREDMDSQAIISSFIPLIFSEKRNKLNDQVKSLRKELINCDDN